VAACISATVCSIRCPPIARIWLLVAPRGDRLLGFRPLVSRRCGGGSLRLLPVPQDVCFPKVEHDPVISDITKVGYYQVRSRAEPAFAEMVNPMPAARAEVTRFRILEDHPPAPAQSLTSARR
jgi:hypothetical protein